MEWNREQKQVIESRNANILVSAAAGSGKTAVLVERILGFLMDKEDPCNIDEFLIVTFTNAAAAQMREKIEKKIGEAVRANPDDSHLVKQMSLIHKADITTIDGFCMRILKEYFHTAGIDSAFTIMDSHLMELLKDDILDSVFRNHYETEGSDDSGEDSFLRLAEAFSAIENDNGLKKIILEICKVADSAPEPKAWLTAVRKNAHIKTKEELDRAPWMKAYIADIKRRASLFLDYAQKGIEICNREGGCGKNIEVAMSDMEILKKIANARTYQEIYEGFQLPVLRLKNVGKDVLAQENYQQFKDNREQYIKAWKKLAGMQKEPESILKEIENTGHWLDALIDLSFQYLDCLSEEKKKRRQYEFSDIAHMAYHIVCQGYDEEGIAVSTENGKRISERYRAIFIDEYQDSNYIQEDILTAVSKRHLGIQNLFMVGDVKQSIYRFRMARPELFLEKYRTYVETVTDDVKNRRINLKTNYRSRPEVLNAVNFIFENIMKSDLGGIQYDEDAALKYGSLYPETEETIQKDTELLLVTDMEREENETAEPPDDELEEMNALEYEAYAVAKRIRELTDSETGISVWKEEEGKYVPAQYRDCMILLRSVRTKGGVFERILTQEGIPVSLDNPNGYFDALEVRTMLSMLSVIDNARQDIPLAAVLLSPLADLTEDEMAYISAEQMADSDDERTLYDRCRRFIERYSGSENETYDQAAGKLEHFFNILDLSKQKRAFLSISELIQYILKLTSYDIYISALPHGKRRIANINMLMEKAAAFEKGDYQGLFNFLRYMEKIRIHDLDFGEAMEANGSENVVRITTMHKSKGLEYPIVFVSGLGQKFFKGDTKLPITIHLDHYISMQYIDFVKRIRRKSFMQEIYQYLENLDDLAEEQRLLYVAMTRAREKLILTGSVKKFPESGGLDYSARSSVSGYLGWIMPCINKDPQEKYLKRNFIDRRELLSGYAKDTVQSVLEYTDAETRIADQDVEKELAEAESRYHYEYPFMEAVNQKVKMSVTEIKKLAMYRQSSDESETAVFGLQEEQKNTGAKRGTVIHKLMELLDFNAVHSKEEMQTEFKRLLKLDIFDDEERKVEGLEKVAKIFESDIFRRMQQADADGLLYKEQQFTAGVPASHIRKEITNPDMVIVQGIIDVFFYENDEIVLLDYKTDRVDCGGTLAERYQTQLDYYAETLERLTGKKVKEKLIYSFALNEIVSCS